jgi:uncharacterized membrane protein YphA (DoxX/SURF4 family)
VLGVAAVLAGIDKFFNLLTNWEQYLNPIAPRLLHIAPVTFMHVVGVIEMAAGIGILAGVTELFGYVMCIWLLGIAGDLVSTGKFFDVALRDLGLAVSAFSLAQLSSSWTTAKQTSAFTNPAISLQRHLGKFVQVAPRG